MGTYQDKEKRKFPRVSHGVKVVYKFMGVSGEKEEGAVDIGQGGIRLLLKEKAKPGSLLELGMSLPHDPGLFFTLAKVAWQSEKGKLAPDKEFYYETGVEFVKMDVEHKMLMIQYIHNRLKKENSL